jgi:hypothetical protein
MHGTIKKYILHLFDNYNKFLKNARYNNKKYIFHLFDNYNKILQNARYNNKKIYLPLV